MWIVISISLLLLCIFLIFRCLALLNLNGEYESQLKNYNDWFEILNKKVHEANELLTIIDNKGSFKADDEVGWTFDTIKQVFGWLQEILEGKTIENKKQ